MSRNEARDILVSRLAGAPNLEHYKEWLDRQPDYVLINLAEGRQVHGAATVSSEASNTATRRTAALAANL